MPPWDPAIDKPAALYVPVNYDLDRLPEPYRWPAAYLLSTIHWRTCCWKAEQDRYVPLKWEYLTKVIPKELWRPLLNRYLDGWNDLPQVVETTCLGEGRCRGYRLAEDYRQVRRIVCTDPVYNEKIHSLHCREDQDLLPIHHWLRSRLDLLHFNLKKARQILTGLHPDPDEDMSLQAYRSQLDGHCQRLAYQDHRLSCDRFGRVHTLLTNLPKELRPCLRLDGRPLVGLDLRNSQPLIAGMFARQYFVSRNARWKFLHKDFTDRKQPYCFQEVHQMARSCQPSLPKDLRAYIRSCEAGTFYESFLEAGEDRSTFKTKFFEEVLFGRNRVPYPRPIKARFDATYPSLATYFATFWDGWTIILLNSKRNQVFGRL